MEPRNMPLEGSEPVNYGADIGGSSTDSTTQSDIDPDRSLTNSIPKNEDEDLSDETHLHTASDSVTDQTTAEPKSYLTDLSCSSTHTDLTDIMKAQKLLENINATNPGLALGWMAHARLLEVAGNLVQARKVIAEGCKHCPHSEEVWLEAARLNPDQTVAKALLAHPGAESVPAWIAAANIETDLERKRQVYRLALEHIPNSPVLWRAAVELEAPDDARVMLMYAVECVPHNTEMWLVMAKLETYENAKKVLNKARQTIPTDKAIWIAAAQLEEANGNGASVSKIIQKAIKSLADGGVKIDHNEWLQEAQQSEKASYAVTCQSIVMETMGIGIEEEDRKSVWCQDADNCIASGFIQTARAIYTHAITTYPQDTSFWLRMVDLERDHGTKDSLEQVIKHAKKMFSDSDVSWLVASEK